MPFKTCFVATLAVCGPLVFIQGEAQAAPQNAVGTLPRGADGTPLNLDFETGDLSNWRAEGEAFRGQPVKGDAVAARRSDMKSRHAGEFWVGTFERAGDAPQGTLTSSTFTLTHPYARFLIAGGSRETTRVEVVRADDQAVLFKAYGDDTEVLKPVGVDLSAHLGKQVFVRVVDKDSGPWGHVNFDDFRLWSVKPPEPLRANLPSPDVFAHEGLKPEDAAAAMTLPPGFKATLFAGEPDVVQPIAFTTDDRGRVWVAEAYNYPIRVPADKARDRILIFEDKDRDGKFDGRKVFADKLNLVSGLEVGHGGVWVGAAPELLFIPDGDGDDVADGPPEVVLDGWGYHDTHETLNSFNWGPDGWLYGCHGVFTHSRVGKPGSADSARVPLNAGIWRYHPRTRAFEVFAQGTSNPWGVDFDAHGQAFLTSCVIPHLYHVVQGGRFERQAGQHFNPYTFDDIKTIADHRHFVGANPHAANGRSDGAGGGHAHAGALIYLGDAWPREYLGSILMNNIHGARLNRDVLEPKGSGFVGRHAKDFLLANDRWSQIVSLRQGPDGQMFMIDWYDQNQCHRTDPTVHDRTNGRVFKVSYGTPKPPAEGSLGSLAFDRRVDVATVRANLLSENEWLARHTLRFVAERAWPPALREMLASAAFSDLPETKRLRFLWALGTDGGLDEDQVARGLADGSAYVRAWTIQLAAERRSVSSATLARFAELAKTDPLPVVRLYLASAMQRLPLESRWDVLGGLLGHSEDAVDPNLPLMAWYAAEPLAEADARRALKLVIGSKLPGVLPFMVRRVSALGTNGAIGLLVDAIGGAADPGVKATILEGLVESLQGRRQVEMPGTWPAVSGSLARSADPRVRSNALSLALTFGDPVAMTQLRAALKEKQADPQARRDALTALLKARDPNLPEVLRSLMTDGALRGKAIQGLAAYDDPASAPALIGVYATLSPQERRDALNTLAARPASSKALLAAVEAGTVAPKDLSADLVRQLRNHKNAEIDASLGKVWGSVRETSADKAKSIDRYRSLLKARTGKAADPMLGRAVYARTCQQCHVLFGTGGKVGPELTGSNRGDLEYVLSNVLDPGALIGKDYLAHVLATTDGRILTGIIKGEDKDAITLQTANEVVVLPRNEVDARRPSDQSMMPDDLWKPLTDHEVRSLVAYLGSPAQVPMLATAENVGGFYNGRDLAGWLGAAGLWSVEAGEIVGKTAGLKRNEFLRSDLAAEDFKLTLKIKLVGDKGNSGVQFRSEALPDGEMKGYQADAGPGWWGKLYEENGRALLWSKSGEEHLRPGDWNTYEILAVGPKIRTSLNGKACASIDDPDGARRGIFAFQLHSGDATEVRFKDLRLELNPNVDPSPAAARP